ncbi:MAG: exodeoxyribonuclease VII large subunit [Phycisphaerales bacterium JB063]
MPRLFDEPPARRNDSKAQTPCDDAMPVVALVGQIKQTLNSHLPGKLRVAGEVSNLSDRNHWFFSLKDDRAAIRCVMFASAARQVRFKVADGQAVIATGRVDVFPAQGQVQFYVDRLEPVGQGALEQQLREMIDELRGLGYFDPEHKRPLPAIPRRIAVVTSRSAAALQDVIDTARRRWAGCELVLCDVRVQGDAAAPQIAAMIDRLSRDHGRLGIDAVLLTRGGGSIEDLWAFNERAVADAIYRCELPVVAAIGHETDVTVAELVADARCATPTQAAMTLVPDRDALSQQVDQLHDRLALALRRRAQHARERLRSAQRHPAVSRPDRLLAAPRDRLAQASSRLASLLPRVTKTQRDRLDALSRHLDAVGPQRVLRRGYTFTTDGEGKVIRSAQDGAAAATLTTVFADGKVVSVPIGGTHADAESAKRLVPQPQTSKPDPPSRGVNRKRKGKVKRDEGPGLFGG